MAAIHPSSRDSRRLSLRDSLPTFSPPGVADSDPVETGEWLDAVVRVSGHERALTLLRLLEEQAPRRGIVANVAYGELGGHIGSYASAAKC